MIEYAHAAADTRILIVDDEPLIRDTLAEYPDPRRLRRRRLRRAARRRWPAPANAASTWPCATCNCPASTASSCSIASSRSARKPSCCSSPRTRTVENAVAAFQRGAHDYLMKPILLDEVLDKIRRCWRYRELSLENQWLRRELNRDDDDERIVGRSPAMQRVFEMVRKVAPTRSTVLIAGESGTGKELIARAIHRLGAGANGRFLAVNCAAIPHDSARKPALRPSQGRLHRRRPRPAGRLRPRRRAARCSSTRSASCRWRPRRSCCGPSSKRKCCRSAPTSRSASSPHPGRDEQGPARRGRSRSIPRGPVLSAQRRQHPDARRCATGARTFPTWSSFSWREHAQTLGKRFTGVTHEAMQLLLACPWKGNVRELDNALQRAVILGEGPLVVTRPTCRPTWRRDRRTRPGRRPERGDPAIRKAAHRTHLAASRRTRRKRPGGSTWASVRCTARSRNWESVREKNKPTWITSSRSKSISTTTRFDPPRTGHIGHR